MHGIEKLLTALGLFVAVVIAIALLVLLVPTPKNFGVKYISQIDGGIQYREIITKDVKAPHLIGKTIKDAKIDEKEIFFEFTDQTYFKVKLKRDEVK